MVATRRGARTDRTEEPETQDASLTLRKKPVRRATAATAATTAKSAQPSTRTRATRSKKTDADQEDELALPQDIHEVAEEPELVITRATRSKRAETVEPESSRSTRSTKTSTQPKRTTRKIPVESSETGQDAQPAPTKPALAARPTRQTRAKTPTTSSPLSPKKITQVSRVRTRGAKATEDEKPKPAPRARPTPTTHSTRSTRKRTVSDENADIPVLGRVEPVAATAEPTKAISPQKKSPAKEQPVEEEEFSSRQTTPAQSPGVVFEQPKDYTEDDLDAADLDQTDEEEEGEETAEQPPSDDELCGPKTPMKRSHKAQSQYHSSSKSRTLRNDPDVPLQTPRRRGARGGTPHTQKPSQQLAASESVARPMTVARADDRAFVFRKPEKRSTPISDKEGLTTCENHDVENSETTAEDAGESDHDVDEGVGRVNLEDETSDCAGRSGEIDSEETIVLDVESDEEHHDMELADSPVAPPPEFSHEFMEGMADEDASLVEPAISADRLHDDHDDSSLIEPPTADYEEEDSMVNMDSPIVEPPVASYEVDLDGSVVIHSADGSESEEASEDEGVDYTEFGLKTPRPETIPWHNIRDDNTIPIDFDLHFADARSSARVDHDFSLAATDMDMPSFEANLPSVQNEDIQEFMQDPTINMNDFVDMAALTEPTMQLDAVAGAVQDESEELDSNRSSPEDMDETQDTVIITKPASPIPVAHDQDEPCGATPSSDKARSATIRESLQQLARMNSQTETGTGEASDDVLEEVDASDGLVPHYALPTLSSRRKSLPSFGHQTPASSNTRPKTSDGSTLSDLWRTMPRRLSTVDARNPATPVRSASARRISSARKSFTAIRPKSPFVAGTPVMRLGERFPRRTPKDSYNTRYEAQTVAGPSRFRTPSQAPARYPATVQKLEYQQTQQQSTPKNSATSTPVPLHGHDNKGEQANTTSVPLRLRSQDSPAAKNPATVQKPASQTFPDGTSSSTQNAPVATPQERFPRRSARQTYDERPGTVAAPARFHTPIQGKPRRPATVQRVTSQHALQGASSQQVTPTQTPRRFKSQKTPQVVTPSADAAPARFPRLPPKEAYEAHVDAGTKAAPDTPKARFPRLPPRQTYDERANTVVAPSRFRSPAHASPRRPATSQKPVNLRKVALKSAAPGGPQTPMKTPLKAPGETPSQVPMTPHPGAPLRGVLALVEVFTLDGASASAPFISLLQRLGAKTTKSWSERVTHVIFKDGSPTTLQRVRLNNKEVEKNGKGFLVHCVNSRWVSDCDASGSRVDEDDDAYAVDLNEVPRGGGRRRKSMEPSALINVGGNIVRDRKSSGRQSIGRSSLGRSAMKVGSAEKSPDNDVEFTPVAKWQQSLQDEDDFEDDESEISTPDYLAAPDKLVQMTAPMNRVRKLDLSKDASKNRRMTSFWEGGE